MKTKRLLFALTCSALAISWVTGIAQQKPPKKEAKKEQTKKKRALPKVATKKGAYMGVKDTCKVDIKVTPYCSFGGQPFQPCLKNIKDPMTKLSEKDEFFFVIEEASQDHVFYTLLHNQSKNINRLQLLSQEYFYKKQHNPDIKDPFKSSGYGMKINTGEALILGPITFDNDKGLTDHVTFVFSDESLKKIDAIDDFDNVVSRLEDITADPSEMDDKTFKQVNELHEVLMKPGSATIKARVKVTQKKGVRLPDPKATIVPSKPAIEEDENEEADAYHFKGDCREPMTFSFKRK